MQRGRRTGVEPLKLRIVHIMRRNSNDTKTHDVESIYVRKLHRPRMSDCFLADIVSIRFQLVYTVVQQVCCQ